MMRMSFAVQEAGRFWSSRMKVVMVSQISSSSRGGAAVWRRGRIFFCQEVRGGAVFRGGGDPAGFLPGGDATGAGWGFESDEHGGMWWGLGTGYYVLFD